MANGDDDVDDVDHSDDDQEGISNYYLLHKLPACSMVMMIVGAEKEPNKYVVLSVWWRCASVLRGGDLL